MMCRLSGLFHSNQSLKETYVQPVQPGALPAQLSNPVGVFGQTKNPVACDSSSDFLRCYLETERTWWQLWSVSRKKLSVGGEGGFPNLSCKCC